MLKQLKDDIIYWIRDYFAQDCNTNCSAVVGISGGKDSSVTAALCVHALGAQHVFGVLMPMGNQYDINISHRLVEFLGIKHCVININDTTNTLFNAINEGGLIPNRQTQINTPARIRMSVLYAVSSIINGRVANTCNLSESWVGYSTKYGDSAGDFSPLSLLTVSEVKLIGKNLGLPSVFVDKTPEDGLSGLSDEDNLGFSYDILDKYIRTGVCDNSVIKHKIDELHKNNLHKIDMIPSFNPNLATV